MATFTPADNMQSMAVVHLSKFRTWLGSSNRGFIGEFGVPKDRASAEQDKWNAMQDIMLHKMAADGLGWTFWATGHLWRTTYNVSYYQNDGTPGDPWTVNASAATVEPHYHDNVPFVGGNYSGHEFYNGSTPAAQSDIQFHYDRGIRVFRLPLSPAFLYPNAGGGIDSNNLAHVTNTLNRAAAVGMKIMMDVLHPGSSGDYCKMFGTPLSDSTALANYKDYVSKLLNTSMVDQSGSTIVLKNHTALWAIDMCNEPANVSTSDWETISQTIYSWLRSTVGFTKKIMVPIGFYSGVHSISQYHPNGPWINPVSGDTEWLYECHFYPNIVGQYGPYDGTFTNNDGSNASYDSNLAQAGSFAGQGEFSYTPANASSDTTPPSAPSNLVLSAVTQSGLTITWNPSTDDVGVTGYRVYRDGVIVTSTTATAYTDAGLQPGTTYTYSVKAYDAGNNQSAASPSLAVKTASSSATVDGQINFDSGDTTTTGYVNSVTLSHTASGDNRLAIAVIASRSIAKVTTVTYNGIAMTLAKTASTVDVSGLSLYYLQNPPAGPATIAIGMSDYILTSVFVGTYTNVDQTTPVEAMVITAGDTGTTTPLPITTVTNGAMVVHAINTTEDDTITSSSTIRANIANSDANLGSLGVADMRVPTAGSLTTSWSLNVSDNYSLVAIALRPATVGTGVTQSVTKIWNGTTWVQKPIKYWNGTAWIEKPLKIRTGTNWT